MTLPTIATHTSRKLRNLYFTTWGRPWPEPDSYLAVLWLESRATNNALTTRRPPPAVWDDTLTLMRESHEFTPAPSGEFLQ